MKLVRPRILGVVNITEDSFSDGGLYLAPQRAIEHCQRLLAAGADAIDLGPASSNPDAKPVAPDEEIRRLTPVVEWAGGAGARISVDSFRPETQLWALGRGVAFINDIHGFPEPAVYPRLAESHCKLIVMHSVQSDWKAERVATDPATILDRVTRFFDDRIATLQSAGVARDRIIIDPGMGFFLGSNVESSLAVLRGIKLLRGRFGLPVMVCVSRKSFLRTLTGQPVEAIGPATLAAELYATMQGVDYLRTHDVRALSDALKVMLALAG